MMNNKEIESVADNLRDKTFSCYGYFGLLEENHTVKIPREGDWVKWIADAIYTHNQGLIEENKRLRETLKEAISEVESWGAYASEYFQKKWDLEGTIAELKRRLND